MKMTLITILSFFTLILTAPPNGVIAIAELKPIHYDSMLDAFMFVESSYRTDVVNSLGYTGILQIGEEMVNEVNRICRIKGIPKSFTLTDRLDSTKSVQMWYIVQSYWNPDYTLKKAAKLWNPLATNNYYKKIKARI